MYELSIALALADDFRRDSDLFAEGVRAPEAQRRIAAAMKPGLQTRERNSHSPACWATCPDR